MQPTEPVAGDGIPPPAPVTGAPAATPEPAAGDPAATTELVASDPYLPAAPDAAELARINAEYLRRKRRYNLVLLGWLLYGALVLFILRPGEIGTMVCIAAGVPFIYAGVLYVWRCPRCNGYLGATMAVHRCPGCNVVLDPRG